MRVGVLVSLLLFLCISPAQAAQYYVRISGNDSSNGTSPATAFRTIQRALTAAQPGDVIYIGRGNFSGGVASVRAGTATARIRLIGDHQGTYTGDKGTPTISVSSGTGVTITHAYIDLERINIANGSTGLSVNATGITLRSCVLRNSTTLIRVSGGSLSLTSCTLRSSTDGVAASGGSITLNACNMLTISGNIFQFTGAVAGVIDRNTFRTSTGVLGLWASTGTLTFTNNLVRQIGGGLNVSAGTARIYNNTFYQPGSTALLVSGGSASVFSNIFTQAGSALVVSGGTATHNNNLYYLNSTNHTGVSAAINDVFADPRFVNPSSNWNIQNSSPCIDTGANASSITTLDRNGATRPRGPAFDIGAYEVVGPSAPVPYFTDFEAVTTPGSEWTSTATLNSAQSSRFAGPFANNSLGLRIATTPGADYTLIFDVYFMNTWDGDNTQYGPDYFNVSVDGDILLRSTYSLPSHNFPYAWPDLPESWRTGFTGVCGSAGVFRSITLDFTAENSVSFVTFFGENLQGWSDEGWGIDNVRVVPSASADQYRPAFTEAGRLNGFRATMNSVGGGLFAADFNNDGFIDILQGVSTGAVRSLNTGSSFINTTTTGFSRQAALADFDSDNDIDVWASTNAGSAGEFEVFLRNNGGGTFSAVAVPGVTTPSNNEGIVACDFNNDGIADIGFFSANGNHTLIRNTASTPLAYTLTTGLLPTSVLDAGNGTVVASGDVNNDGFPDFFYLYNAGRLLLSNPDGTYSSDSRGIAVSSSDAVKISAAFADYDNDGDLDLFVASRSSGNSSLWQSPGDVGSFANVAAARGLAISTPIAGCAWGDYDNDGDLDLFLTPVLGLARLMQNQGPPFYTFTEVTREGVSVEAAGGDAMFTDVNNDGQLDLAVTSESSSYPSALFLNEHAIPDYLLVRVLGKGPGGLNLAGVGARLELWNSTNTVFHQRRDLGAARGFGQEPLWAHFGGVNPAARYMLRIITPRQTYNVPVVPATASTTIGSTTIPQMFTFDESLFAARLRVVRWREAPLNPDEDR